MAEYNRWNAHAQSAATSQREEQINFLDLVIHEYLQRMLYHKKAVDDKMVMEKAAEVSDCMAIARFHPSVLWLMELKEKFGLKDFSRNILLRKMKLNGEKQSTMDPVDMVRYVQQQKNFIEEQISRQSMNNDSSYTNGNESQSKKDVPMQQLRNTKMPKIINKKNDITVLHDIMIGESTIKIKSSDSGPKTSSQIISERVTQNAQTINNNTRQGLRKSHIPVTSTNQGNNCDDDEEYLTIYAIIDDENESKSQAADKHKSSNPLLGENVKCDDITNKTEQPSDDDEPMASNANQIATFQLPKDVIIKRERKRYSSLQLDDNDDIKPTATISQEYITENNNATNDQPTNTNKPDVPNEDIKPTIIDNTNDHNQSLNLANRKRQREKSSLAEIDTLEEAMEHLNVVENYVMLIENCRAICLVVQLKEAIKKSPNL